MPALLPFSMVKPETWPGPFRLFQDARAQPDDPLNISRAVRWRPATFHQYTIGLGYFLGWLHWSGRYRQHQAIPAYVTRETAKAYLADMRKFGLAPPTIANRLDALHAALIVLAPGVDGAWLMAGINRLRSQPSDRRRTRERVQHTEHIVEAGMRLMREAHRMDDSLALWSAIQFRDGLLLVFAAILVPRIGTLPKMMLGRHVVEIGAGYKISWPAEEMKGGQPYEARLGPELSALLGRYIDKHRPVLLARRKKRNKGETAFWLTRDGAPLGQRALALRITARTKTLLGVSVFPHALRHGAATTLALERPELIDTATPLLQHRHSHSRQRYNMADSVAAGREFGEALEGRRASTRDGRGLMRRLSRVARTSGANGTAP